MSRREVVALVGCGKQKLPIRSEAQDLYTGNLFRAARAWAEKHADRWFILSAKYGLLGPGNVIDPYDVFMGQLNRVQKETWGSIVRISLKKAGVWDQKLVFLAGAEYARAVSGAPHVDKPLEGLGLGERLRWFKQNT